MESNSRALAAIKAKQPKKTTVDTTETRSQAAMLDSTLATLESAKTLLDNMLTAPAPKYLVGIDPPVDKAVPWDVIGTDFNTGFYSSKHEQIQELKEEFAALEAINPEAFRAKWECTPENESKGPTKVIETVKSKNGYKVVPDE